MYGQALGKQWKTINSQKAYYVKKHWEILKGLDNLTQQYFMLVSPGREPERTLTWMDRKGEDLRAGPKQRGRTPRESSSAQGCHWSLHLSFTAWKTTPCLQADKPAPRCAVWQSRQGLHFGLGLISRPAVLCGAQPAQPHLPPWGGFRFWVNSRTYVSLLSSCCPWKARTVAVLAVLCFMDGVTYTKVYTMTEVITEQPNLSRSLRLGRRGGGELLKGSVCHGAAWGHTAFVHGAGNGG